jgi:hypothetical protein
MTNSKEEKHGKFENKSFQNIDHSLKQPQDFDLQMVQANTLVSKEGNKKSVNDSNFPKIMSNDKVYFSILMV